MKKVSLGLVLALLGGAYLLVPLQAARTCLGMECLEFHVASVPVTALSVPWGLPARWLVPDPEVVEASMYRGQLIHPTYWPRYAIVSAGFVFNLFLRGAALQWAWRAHRSGGLRGSTVSSWDQTGRGNP